MEERKKAKKEYKMVVLQSKKEACLGERETEIDRERDRQTGTEKNREKRM